jgi:hypothetical protein
MNHFNLNKETSDWQRRNLRNGSGKGANFTAVRVSKPLVIFAPVDPRDLAAHVLAQVEVSSGAVVVGVVQTSESNTLNKTFINIRTPLNQHVIFHKFNIFAIKNC